METYSLKLVCGDWELKGDLTMNTSGSLIFTPDNSAVLSERLNTDLQLIIEKLGNFKVNLRELTKFEIKKK